jgi:outer membrane PBP1 activator LpoA protein
VYASSQIYSGDAGPAAGIDLAGVTFLDMPWLLQRDRPAVMVYPRQDFRGEADLERLYALGIDAWRIGQALLARQTDLTLDGVTGKLTLGRDRQFVRELVSARIGAHLPPAPAGPPPASAPAPLKPVPTVPTTAPKP